MPTYTPTVKSGDARRRVWRVTIENPLNGNPSARFEENEVVLTADGVEKVLEGTARTLVVDYEPGKALALFNPANLEAIGKTTHDAVMLHLYSLGHQAQLDADAGNGG